MAEQGEFPVGNAATDQSSPSARVSIPPFCQAPELDLLKLTADRAVTQLSFADNFNPFHKSVAEALGRADAVALVETARVEGQRSAADRIPIGDLIDGVHLAFRAFAQLLETEAATRASVLLSQLGDLETAALSAACTSYLLHVDAEQHEALVRLAAENEHLQHADEELTARISELAALQMVNNAVNSTLDLSAVLAQTVDVVSQVTRVEVCSIFLYEENDHELVLRATRGLNPMKIGKVSLRIGEGITGAAAQEGRPIAVQDAWSDPRFIYTPGLDEEPYHAMIAVPIVLYTVHKLIGVLSLHTPEYRSFGPAEVRFLETVAGQIAIAIENARHYGQTDERLRQKVNELTTLQRISALIASTLDLSLVLDQISRLVVEEIGADMSAIYRRDETTGDLVIIASHGLSEEYVRTIVIKQGEGALGTAVATRVPVAVSDALGDTRFASLGPRATRAGYRSICCVPLVSKERTIGGISAYYRTQQQFTQERISMLSTFAEQAAIAIENAQLYEQARRGLVTKSALLLEMHHRVKNNLQTVAALLSLQQRRAKLPSIAQPLGESIARIQSIAAVHDLLSSEQVGQVTFGGLLKPIIEVVMENVSPPRKKIDFVVEGSKVVLGSKEANVLALLLNELVANAIRHGLAPRDAGTITLRARIDGPDTVVQVHHNGDALPAGFDLERDSGLGLQIVQTLVRNDLGGRFDLRNEQGVTAEIIFSNATIPLM